MVATIAILASLPAIAQRVEVSFEHKPARLEVLLAELSKELPGTLSCSASLGDRVLLIAVKDADSETLLNHIADVTDGKWFRNAGGSQLRPDDEALGARRRALLELHKADVESGFEVFFKRATAPFDEAQAITIANRFEDLAKEDPLQSIGGHWERRAAYADLPAARLALKILSIVLEKEPESLPLTKPGRQAFSSLAASPYRRVTVDQTQLKHFDREQAVWDRVASSRIAADTADAYIGASPAVSNSVRPAKTVFLLARRQLLFSNFELAIAILDDEGTYKAGAELAFPTPMSERRYRQGTGKVLQGKTISLSEEASHYARASSTSQEPPYRIARNDPLYNAVLNPEKHDPLGHAAGEVIKQAIAPDGSNVVAELIDDLGWMPARAIDEGGLTGKAVIAELEVRHRAQIVRHDDGFVTMRYEDPDKHITNFPRNSLQALARRIDKAGFLDLNTLVIHGFPGGRTLGTPAPFLTLRILAPGLERHYQTFNQALPQYASAIHPSARDALLAGRSILVGQLDRQSKQSLNRLIVGSSSVYGIQRGFQGMSVPYTLQSMILFPYGLPDDVSLKLEAKPVPGMAAFLPGTDRFAPWTTFGPVGQTIAGIGSRLAETESPPRIWTGEYLRGWFLLERGENRLTEFSFDLPMIDIRGEPLTIEGLPQELQKRIMAAKTAALNRVTREQLMRKRPPPLDPAIPFGQGKLAQEGGERKYDQMSPQEKA